MTTTDLGNEASAPSRGAGSVPKAASPAATTDRLVNHTRAAIPTCGNCKTDTYLYIEEFTAASVDDEGQLAQLPEVSYFCTRCLGYAAHAVPPLWAPDNRR